MPTPTQMPVLLLLAAAVVDADPPPPPAPPPHEHREGRRCEQSDGNDGRRECKGKDGKVVTYLSDHHASLRFTCRDEGRRPAFLRHTPSGPFLQSGGATGYS